MSNEINALKDILDAKNKELEELQLKQDNEIDSIIAKKTSEFVKTASAKLKRIRILKKNLSNYNIAKEKLTAIVEHERGIESKLFTLLLKNTSRASIVSDLAILTNTTIKNPLEDEKTRYGNIIMGDSNVATNLWKKLTTNDNMTSVDATLYGAGHYAIRPVIYSQQLCEMALKKKRMDLDGSLVAYFGEYPQTAPSKSVQRELNNALKKYKLKATGRNYTLNVDENPIPEFEYEIDGVLRKFILVKADMNEKNTVLSNSVKAINGEYYWVEVEPVEWIIDTVTNALISKKGLISNISYNNLKKFYSKYLIDEILGEIAIKREDVTRQLPKDDISFIKKSFGDELERLYDVEFKKDAYDINLDVRVLETMLRIDGLNKKTDSISYKKK